MCPRHPCSPWARISRVQIVNACFVHAESDAHAGIHHARRYLNRRAHTHANSCLHSVLVHMLCSIRVLDVKSRSQSMYKSSVLGDLCAGNVAMCVVGPQGLTSCSRHLSSCAPRFPHRFTCLLSWLTIISIMSIVHPSGYLCHSDFLHVNPDTSERPESGLQCTLAPSKPEDGWLKDACAQQLR